MEIGSSSRGAEDAAAAFHCGASVANFVSAETVECRSTAANCSGGRVWWASARKRARPATGMAVRVGSPSTESADGKVAIRRLGA